MVPIFQTWRKADDFVELVKNRAGAGDHVDIQARDTVKNALETALDSNADISTQWNTQGLLDSGRGPVLTVRAVAIKLKGDDLLTLVGDQLILLGYSRL